jgi:hypothetical protein
MPLGERLFGAGAEFLTLEPYLDGMRARCQRVLASALSALDRLAGVG